MSKKRIITMVKKTADENMKVAIDREAFVNYSIGLIENTRTHDAAMFFTAYMKVLHDEFGFGAGRLKKLNSMADYWISKYQDDTQLLSDDGKKVVKYAQIKTGQTGQKS